VELNPQMCSLNKHTSPLNDVFNAMHVYACSTLGLFLHPNQVYYSVGFLY